MVVLLATPPPHEGHCGSNQLVQNIIGSCHFDATEQTNLCCWMIEDVGNDIKEKFDRAHIFDLHYACDCLNPVFHGQNVDPINFNKIVEQCKVDFPVKFNKYINCPRYVYMFRY